MQTAQITVQYVNPPKPGKKTGSVKDMDGQYWDVWPDKLADFVPNASYQVLYEAREWQGKQYRTIKTSSPLNGGAPVPTNGATHNVSTAPATARPSYQRSETSARDAERMFVCALLVAGIKAGNVEMSGVELSGATAMLRAVWSETFGAEEARQ